MEIDGRTMTAACRRGGRNYAHPVMREVEVSEEPWVHDTATVSDTTLGRYTYVGQRSTVLESELGDYSYVMNDSEIFCATIGKFCNIAAHTRINPANHPMWRAALHHFTYRSRMYGLADDDDEEFFDWRRSFRVFIGHDAWIGHGAIILPGRRVGIGAVVGAGSVVTEDVDDFAIVAGVPARFIRKRFSPWVQEGLLRIAWWDWPRERLREALPDFRRLTAEQFVEKYG